MRNIRKALNKVVDVAKGFTAMFATEIVLTMAIIGTMLDSKLKCPKCKGKSEYDTLYHYNVCRRCGTKFDETGKVV